MSELQVLMYVAYAVLILGTAYKANKIAKMPVHLRWDLYPIPHEKQKGHYGGSYYEELNWWTKPAEVSMRSELGEAFKEIVFIQSMYRNNRSLWAVSFPFHFGLYLLVALVVMVFFGAALGLLGVPISADEGVFSRTIYYVTVSVGLIGSALTVFGAAGLLVSRISREDLRRSSVRSDYFNLALLLSVSVSGLVVFATGDFGLAQTRAFIADLVSFRTPGPVSAGLATHLVLAAVFMIYLPFTHMTHFVGKYFTYHKVRWEDSPNVNGSALESRINEALGYRLTWSAPHIKTGGTWAEAATEETTKHE
jgi:nitrate reductase gamma subunit